MNRTRAIVALSLALLSLLANCQVHVYLLTPTPILTPTPTPLPTPASPGAYDPTPELPVPTPLPPPLTDYAAEVVTLINRERSEGGLEPLTPEPRLMAAAEAHTRDMAEGNFFSHVGSDGSEVAERLEAQGYDWRAYAENLGCGYASPADLVEGWLESPPHRENLFHPVADELGVGFVHDPGSRCGYYWTAVFAAEAD